MKTFVVLALDTRRAKQDGSYPVRLRIIHHGQPAAITTGIYLKEKDWDAKERKIKGSYRGSESVARLNNFLQKKKSQALDLITKLDEMKTLDTFTVLELKDMIERKKDNLSFIAYAEKIIANLKEANKIGTARAHQCAIDAIRKFSRKKDLAFYEINLAFLQRMETDHLKKELSYNGLSAYLRSIRSIFNQAIKEKLVDKELYPFAAYQIKSVKTRKRAISPQALERIEECNLDPEHPLYHARNYFLASFYMRGISFADLAELKLSNLVDGRIYYQRKKTDRPYNIKVHETLRGIIDLYTIGKTSSDYLFPIIKRIRQEDQYRDIEWARKRFNRKLKDLAVLCDIEENLTSYVSRHSFATRAKNLGISTAAISDMLGHGDIKTTQVYLDSLQDDLLDDYHEQVLKKPGNQAKPFPSEAEAGAAGAQPDRNSSA